MLPSLKVTVPVGVPTPGAVTLTVAVKVTVDPVLTFGAEDWSSTLVLALFTTNVLRLPPLVT